MEEKEEQEEEEEEERESGVDGLVLNMGVYHEGFQQ